MNLKELGLSNKNHVGQRASRQPSTCVRKGVVGDLFPASNGGRLPLFEPRPPFQRSSATSRAAAMEARETAGTVRARVRAWVECRGRWGATREEISLGLDLRIQTVCARVDELLREGSVFRTGAVRRTVTGRKAEVIASYLPFVSTGKEEER